ncbi:hypothetical protein PHLGIDRAFT_203356 [Phlebiopsis gigantea 11061_1 CR5-6]|uniref:Uncharacterized protein n=1 Tax=Phlebiopsis gigantea (strain 11061_1 CR5-6) TaxID=745531 RepID=A0A0C3S6P0_PHLG1|nr:hypothetical protein PHLGIDRAFT_203356 [Phlebiopsis gigantea 11061_1 CR5-6]
MRDLFYWPSAKLRGHCGRNVLFSESSQEQSSRSMSGISRSSPFVSPSGPNILLDHGSHAERPICGPYDMMYTVQTDE